jgi:hypothetical protein
MRWLRVQGCRIFDGAILKKMGFACPMSKCLSGGAVALEHFDFETLRSALTAKMNFAYAVTDRRRRFALSPPERLSSATYLSV